jgi:hypothetical protein
MTAIVTPSRDDLLRQPVAGNGYRWNKLLREAREKSQHRNDVSFFQLAADIRFSHRGQDYRNWQAARAIALYYDSIPQSRTRKRKRKEPMILDFVRALVSYVLDGKTAHRPRPALMAA